MIAAMIDGVWLRAALSGWREADSESARALLTAFVERRLQGLRAGAGLRAESEHGRPPERLRRRSSSLAAGERFASINPATGEVLGYVNVAGADEVNAAVARAQRGRRNGRR